MTWLMTNEELADAIAAAHSLYRNTRQDAPVMAPTIAHYKALLEVQRKRAMLGELTQPEPPQ